MIEAGVDLVTVSKILGHSSIQMTMRYAHPTSENKRKAVDVLADVIETNKRNSGRYNPIFLEDLNEKSI